MDWSELLKNLILAIAGVLLSSLGTWLTAVITKNVKEKRANHILSSLTDLVMNCVMETYQTYVESLKNKNMFDEESQKKALAMCLEKIKTNLPTDTRKWLSDNVDDMESLFKTLIESAIQKLKK